MARGKHLGELEGLILLTVLRLKDDAYGARLKTELNVRAGRAVSISTIYVTLMRLEEKGLVRSWLADPTSQRGGRAKRHFQLKPEGVHALRESRATMEAMWDGLEELEGA
jgi:PadR family transcriptional regulator